MTEFGILSKRLAQNIREEKILDWYHLMENRPEVGGSNQRLRQAKSCLWKGLIDLKKLSALGFCETKPLRGFPPLRLLSRLNIDEQSRVDIKDLSASRCKQRLIHSSPHVMREFNIWFQAFRLKKKMIWERFQSSYPINDKC